MSEEGVASDELGLEIVRAWCDAMSFGEGPDESSMRALLAQLEAARRRAPEELRLHRELRTQDNAITADPIFVVQQKRRHVGFDSNYEEDPLHLIWVNSAAETEVTLKSDADRFAELQTGNFGDDDEGDWELFGFTDTWEFVQPFFTREAAEAYRKREAHNLSETRVYVDSAYRNFEWKWIRAYFMGAPK